MRKLILLSVVFVGCHQNVAVPKVDLPKLTDEQKITLLRDEAHKRGLRWVIFCSGHRWKFLSVARHKSEPEHATYIEDGAQAYWIGDGDSQAEAAYSLYQLIQGAEQFQPRHRPDFEKPKWCPPDLRGD